jgi:hypothetical protein
MYREIELPTEEYTETSFPLNPTALRTYLISSPDYYAMIVLSPIIPEEKLYITHL